MIVFLVKKKYIKKDKKRSIDIKLILKNIYFEKGNLLFNLKHKEVYKTFFLNRKLLLP